MKKYTVFSAAALCFRCAPYAALLNLLVHMVGGILPMLLVFVVARFIDEAIHLTSGGPLTPLVQNAFLLLAGYLYSQLSPMLLRLTSSRMEAGLMTRLRPRLIEKLAGIDYKQMEDSKSLDLISFVTEKMESRLTGIFSDLSEAASLLITTTGILSLLAPIAWPLIPAFLLGAVPLAVLSYRGGTALVEKDKEITALTRRMYDLSQVLSGREAAAERTLFGFTKGINEKFKTLHRQRSDLNTKLLAQWEWKAKLCGYSLHLFALAAMAVLIKDVLSGAMTSGAYIALAGAVLELARTLTNALSRFVFLVSGHIGYMKAYTAFLKLCCDEPVLPCAPVKIPFETLEIKNLRFRYLPDGEEILKGVTMTLKKGVSYSLIGVNWAGKSTLTKILTGLYREFEGEILLNGKDIREYSGAELRGLFSIVYQDYARYAVSLRDNILFGEKSDGFDALMEASGLTEVIEKLPSGADTPLGKILENGMDVSGGEWQKIAIARALYKDCPFLILDEPTAALSPTMEGRFYKKFKELSKGHTKLLISHRLGSTKISDQLFVLSDGTIAEAGTHGELMKKGGLYATMFESQRSWYDENEE